MGENMGENMAENICTQSCHVLTTQKANCCSVLQCVAICCSVLKEKCGGKYMYPVLPCPPHTKSRRGGGRLMGGPVDIYKHVYK